MTITTGKILEYVLLHVVLVLKLRQIKVEIMVKGIARQKRVRLLAQDHLVLLRLVLPVIGQTRAVLPIAVMGVVQLLTQNRVIALVLHLLNHVLPPPPVVIPTIGAVGVILVLLQ
jgi:hypothetical protein